LVSEALGSLPAHRRHPRTVRESDAAHGQRVEPRYCSCSGRSRTCALLSLRDGRAPVISQMTGPASTTGRCRSGRR